MASSSTATISSTQCSTSGPVSSPRCLTAMPSASVTTGPEAGDVAEVRRAHRGLDADHPHRGQQRLDGDRHARRQPAAPERNDDTRQVGDVLDQFEAERALPGDHCRVVEGMAERHAVLGRPSARRGEGLVERGAVLDDVGAVGPAGLDLGDRCARGHEDLARHPEVPGSERQRLGVVSGAAGRDAGGRGLAERGDLVHRPADLEGAGALQALGLEHDLAAGLLRQGRRRHDWRALGGDGGDGVGGADVVERHRSGGVHDRHPPSLAASYAAVVRALMIGNVNGMDAGFVGHRLRQRGYAFVECVREDPDGWPGLDGAERPHPRVGVERVPARDVGTRRGGGGARPPHHRPPGPAAGDLLRRPGPLPRPRRRRHPIDRRRRSGGSTSRSPERPWPPARGWSGTTTCSRRRRDSTCWPCRTPARS